MKSPIRFLLSHIEGFVDDEANEFRERAKNFHADTGLEKIEKLTEVNSQDQDLSQFVLERLSAFFDAGLLLRNGVESATEHWWITDLFWKGNCFHLEGPDRIQADHVAIEASPVEVFRAPARRLLRSLQLERMAPSDDSDAFLIKPAPQLAYMLISDLPSPWLPDHVTHAQRLINNCFLY